MARFDGHVAWVTGAGSGIGRSVALELARRGADVVLSGRRQAKLDEVADEIVALGRKAYAIRCDVSDEESVIETVQQIIETTARLDICVANAGFSVAGKFEALTADDWRRQFDVNVVGLAITVKHALPYLRETRGRIALVGSVSGLIATPGMGAYTASKYAVRAIGQTLSIELHGSGVSCTNIYPGFVESEIAQVDNQGVHHPGRKDRRPKKLMWTGERAARSIVNALVARRRDHVFTGHGKVGAFIGQHMPSVAHFVLTRSGAKKRAKKTIKSGTS